MLQEEFNQFVTAIVAAVRVGDIQQFKRMIQCLTKDECITLSRSMCIFLEPHPFLIPFLTLVKHYNRQDMLNLLLQIEEIEKFAPVQCSPPLLMQYGKIHDTISQIEKDLANSTMTVAVGPLSDLLNTKKRKTDKL